MTGIATSAEPIADVTGADSLLRPSLRGTLHRWSVPVAVALTGLLALRAPTGGTRATVIVYGLCVTLMLGVSGTYHAPRLFHRPRRLLRRFDHAAIFFAIAGTYTAVILLALDGATRIVLLVLAWVVGLAGVAIRMVWFEAHPGLAAAVYLAAGWMIVLDLPAFASALSGAELALLAVGGGLYTLGAVVYAMKWPDPRPDIFGYHEVFHAFVIGGALAQWFAVFSLTA
jgi:hemolysin III